MKAVLTLVLIGAAFAGGYYYAKRGARAADQPGQRKILYWHDPMHPSYRSDKPGIAPDCGMRLEPVYADEAPKAANRKIAYYHDPQQPTYRSDKPGLNPETGNDLVPVYEEPVPGTITVPADRQQLIGVTYAVAGPAHAEGAIRAVGRIAYDESRIARINSRIEGWVDRVFVDQPGQQVRAGDPLLTIYSPEMLASQEEYLLALKAKNMLAGSTVPGVLTQSDSLIEASRRRLELFDLSAEQIESVRTTGKPVQNITLYSPVSGVVTERKVYQKMRISPEMELYSIADLSHLWVYAEVFEYEAPNVRIGMPATIHLSNLGGGAVSARVTQILPEVDPQTRTLKVRLDIANQQGRLRPDMFVDVDFRIHHAAAVSLPASAILDAGLRKTVYVDKGGGVLEPRQVQTGARIGDRVEILSGVSAGERVVSSGNFLIDSESQLKAAAAGAGAGAHSSHGAQPAESKPPAAAGEHHHHD